MNAHIFDEFDKCLVLHQDDVGMCHGANVAFAELSAMGSITSGSVMVPCPWFNEAAEIALNAPVIDMGVHLTLTSEKQHYRWAPLIGASQSSGLVDSDGYMWRDVSSVRRNANVNAVADELSAQVERAYERGIDVTHLDAHMGTALAIEFCAIYLTIAARYELPALITSELSGYGPRKHLAGINEEQFAPYVDIARKTGIPIFDRVFETDFTRPNSEPLEDGAYQKMFSGEMSGLSFAALHPNSPGEIEMIEPDQSHVRTDEYQIFRSEGYHEWLSMAPFRRIGMRALRDAMRNASK